MIVADVRVITAGGGSSQEQPVEHFIRELDAAGLEYEVGPMSTVVQTHDLPTLFDALAAAHRAIREDAPRVFTQVNIDDRRDADETMDTLTEGVEAGEPGVTPRPP